MPGNFTFSKTFFMVKRVSAASCYSNSNDTRRFFTAGILGSTTPKCILIDSLEPYALKDMVVSDGLDSHAVFVSLAHGSEGLQVYRDTAWFQSQFTLLFSNLPTKIFLADDYVLQCFLGDEKKVGELLVESEVRDPRSFSHKG